MYIKAVFCYPAYLTYMQSTSCEMWDWMKHKLESRLQGEISIVTSDMQMTPPLWGFPGSSDGKASAYSARGPGLIPGSEDPLEKEMATHSNILARRIPWTEEPGGLQSIGSQRFGHN